MGDLTSAAIGGLPLFETVADSQQTLRPDAISA
jgi:hypothetical protein